jgi:hypothetical protein
VYTHTAIPELDLALYRAFEHEMAQRLEIRRLGDLDRSERPTLGDRLLLTAGAALVATGEWLRERSHLACPTTQLAR